ncbi:pyridoxal phosphate-dependent aminotransferase [Candidatus Thiothrix anitrata]|uniref:Aminotransferase n=1 Tax=Candidatus Thiothrix anitrata TaxID=2823902 RepID=A0ABX7X7Z4_9GAMM|nr:pyridoxal phosphate-dependent aminotransferase [Candidatus Thiothrix anitrata]QTR50759.1 pyridoxal phosphate-dependent aminotransferase [Candidatus Thiothrix anitrata]
MRYAAQFSDTISLGQGTPLFPTPYFIYEALLERSKVDGKIGMYSDAIPEIEKNLIELIKKQIDDDYGFYPNSKELILTLGGIGALFSSLMALIEKGDEIIFFDPSYPLHLSQIHLAEATPIFVSLKENDGWSFNIDSLKKAITKKTRAIILTNPNNPTGTVLSEADVRAIAETVISNNLILILDEAYFVLTYGKEIFSPLFIPELRKHTILCRSFSKEYAMTGWRIGYAYAPSELAERIFNIHTYFSICPPTPSMVAVTAAISDPRGKEAMAEMIKKISESRNAICTRLDNLPNLFTYHTPQGAFYVFPKFLGFEMPDMDFAKLLIKETGVITVGGSSMGPSGMGHLRMSFASDISVIHKAFDRIDKFYQRCGL